MGTEGFHGPSFRVLMVFAIGGALLATGLVWTLGWLAIWNPFVHPSPPSPYCECGSICFCPLRSAFVTPPSPVALLLAYVVAVPFLTAMGLRIARSGASSSKASRASGWLLFGTMAAIGGYTLPLLVIHPPFVAGTRGTTWLVLSLVAYLVAPALVLGSGGVLLGELRRRRFIRRPPASVG